MDGQQTEAVFHRDQTKVHHKCIVGCGGLGDDDEWSLQPDVHGNTETLLGQVSNAGRRPLCCLGGGGAQSFFSHLEVVGEVLRSKRKRRNKSAVRKQRRHGAERAADHREHCDGGTFRSDRLCGGPVSCIPLTSSSLNHQVNFDL